MISCGGFFSEKGIILNKKGEKMANIMMTDVCNLRCPYCFANEFVNKDTNEISEENFRKAVDFIVGDGSHSSVGLIGGEPTVHSHFEE